MKIVIVGLGRIGESLTRYLSQEGHDVVVIDINQDLVLDIVNRYDVRGICGNGAFAEILSEAQAEEADLLIALTPADEKNILCCLVGKALGAKHTIARVRDPEYAGQFAFMHEQLGISLMINPEQQAAEEISRLLRIPSALAVDYFAGGKIDMVEIRIGNSNPLIGLSLRETASVFKVKVLICTVERDNKVIIPDGNFVINSGDIINVCAEPQELELFFKKLGIYKQKVQSTLIIGGGKITYYLAKGLAESGIKVKVIEKNRARCLELKGMLHNVNVICADGTDREVLEEEGINHVDSLVVVTGNDERNIVLSLFAKNKGLKKLVTKVNNDSFTGILEDIELDSIIAPKQVSCEQIIKYVRALGAPEGSEILSLYKLLNDRAEAMEFALEPDNIAVGNTLRDLKLKPSLLIAGILRGGKTIIPSGSTVLEGNDRIIVVTTGTKLTTVADIFD